jgi:hypothetical protein
MLHARLRAPETAFVALAFLLPPLAVLAPKGVVVLLLAGAALALLGFWLRREPWPALPRRPLIALGLLLLWCALAATWSFDVGRALRLVLRLAALFAAGAALHLLANALGAGARRRVAGALSLGLALGLLVMLEERLFGFPLLDLLRGEAASAYHALSRLNRGATALAILCWPVAAVLWHRGAGVRALVLPAGLFAGLFLFESSAALLGLACGLALAAVGLTARRLARPLLILALLGGLLAGPLVASGLYAAGASEATWLQSTARHRVHVWNFTAERIAERPLIGWGLDAARDIPDSGATPYGGKTRNMPSHPHNGALQIFLELGLVGAGLSAALLILLIGRLEHAPPAVRLCGLAMAATAFAVALTAYGMWQSQWIALLLAASVMVPATAPESET